MQDLTTSLSYLPAQTGQPSPPVGAQVGAQAGVGAQVGAQLLTVTTPSLPSPAVTLNPQVAANQPQSVGGGQPGITTVRAQTGSIQHSSLPNMGQQVQGQSQQPSTLNSQASADMINGQLTSALDRLSLAIDPAMEKNNGMIYRPEYYVQHLDKNIPIKNLDHSKLSMNSLYYGMCRVLKHLLLNGGETQAYVNHMLYISKLASLGEYTEAAFINYDRCVVDAVLAQEIKTFVPGYTLATSLNFHTSNMIRNQAVTSYRGRGRGRGRGAKIQTGNRKCQTDSLSTYVMTLITNRVKVVPRATFVGSVTRHIRQLIVREEKIGSSNEMRKVIVIMDSCWFHRVKNH